jgi:GAF domain-containing protein
MGVQAILDELLAETGASRVTLRQDVAGDTFPVTYEALGSGVPSIKDVETPNMAGQPVVLEVIEGRQVVQDDCEPLYPTDGPFHEMRALYGGLTAQIVTPVLVDGRVAAIVSVHQLGRTRAWNDEDAAGCRRAAGAIAGLI